MSNKQPSDHSIRGANSTLDALLQKGIQADQRATKPMILPTPATPPIVRSRPVAAITETIVRAPQPTLERLSVRFTQDEARLLEKARGVARSMGFKISDNAVFRLALNAFQSEQLTPQAIESILTADGRRRPN